MSSSSWRPGRQVTKPGRPGTGSWADAHPASLGLGDRDKWPQHWRLHYFALGCLYYPVRNEQLLKTPNGRSSDPKWQGLTSPGASRLGSLLGDFAKAALLVSNHGELWGPASQALCPGLSGRSWASPSTGTLGLPNHQSLGPLHSFVDDSLRHGPAPRCTLFMMFAITTYLLSSAICSILFPSMDSVLLPLMSL